MKIRLASPLQVDSIVDGEGLRAVIWTQGCPHKCLGCHNLGTHDFNAGFEVDIKDLKKEIDELESLDGITLSGGEPFAQAAACAKIAKIAHERKINVWSYSGYTFEELIKMSKINKSVLDLLENIDILVDGKFMIEFRSLSILFRGSTNQRIIDIKKSLKKRKVILVEKYIAKDLNEEKLNIYI